MLRMNRPVGTMLVVSLSFLGLSGCAGPQSRSEPAKRTAQPERSSAVVARPAEAPAAAAKPAPPAKEPPPVALAAQEQTQASAPTTPAAQPDEKAQADAAEKVKKEAEEKAKKEAKEARDRERKLVKLQRDLEVAKLRFSKLKLDHENAQTKYEQSLARTKIDLEIAKKKLQDYKQIHVPTRIARAELNLKWAESALLEAQQELEQLELMYSEEQFADKTKEIVIERAKRQLERTQRDTELRREEHKTLLGITIPQETKDQELGVEDKERALAQTLREEPSTRIDRQIAVMNAEAEITRLENELADLQEEIKEAVQKKAEEQQKKEGGEKAGETKGR
jgi:hypothetical protein